jgi:hypothetical protein
MFEALKIRYTRLLRIFILKKETNSFNFSSILTSFDYFVFTITFNSKAEFNFKKAYFSSWN